MEAAEAAEQAAAAEEAEAVADEELVEIADELDETPEPAEPRPTARTTSPTASPTARTSCPTRSRARPAGEPPRQAAPRPASPGPAVPLGLRPRRMLPGANVPEVALGRASSCGCARIRDGSRSSTAFACVDDLRFRRPVERSGRLRRAVEQDVVEVGRRADAVAPQARPLVLVCDADVEEGLVDPVDDPVDRDARVEHQVDDVRRGEVLHVLDADLEQPRLVPDVEPVEVAELVLRLERVDDQADRLADQRLLEELPAHRGEDTDHERDREERGVGDVEVLVEEGNDGPHEQDHDDEAHRRVDVRRRLQVVLEVAAHEHLEDVEVGAEEAEGEGLRWRILRQARQLDARRESRARTRPPVGARTPSRRRSAPSPSRPGACACSGPRTRSPSSASAGFGTAPNRSRNLMPVLVLLVEALVRLLARLRPACLVDASPCPTPGPALPSTSRRTARAARGAAGCPGRRRPACRGSRRSRSRRRASCAS